MSMALDIMREIYPPKGPRCRRGHRMTPRNIYHMATGEKVCKQCSNAASRAWYAKNRQSILAQKKRNAKRAVGRPAGEALTFARSLGITKRQIHKYGMERMLAMSPEARAFIVGQMKKKLEAA